MSAEIIPLTERRRSKGQLTVRPPNNLITYVSALVRRAATRLGVERQACCPVVLPHQKMFPNSWLSPHEVTPVASGIDARPIEARILQRIQRIDDNREIDVDAPLKSEPKQGNRDG